MAKERPILFSTEMVQAILTGKKTQTRRLLKDAEFLKYATDEETVEFLKVTAICPYGAVGDKLWVREKFAPKHLSDEPPGQSYHYFADDSFVETKWKPSIHMPRVASRITLKLTDIRIERLHDMSDEDAIAEGIKMANDYLWKDYTDVFHGFYFDAKITSQYGKNLSGEVTSYASLWTKINGFESWLSNPWVWVLTFDT